MKKIIFFILKFAIAAGLLIWLTKSGKIDFSLISQSFIDSPLRWCLSILMLGLMISFGSYRWKLLLDSKLESPISILKAIKLSWIGSLFNPLLPGAVSGDLVKVYYAKKLEPELSSGFLLLSVLIDRVLGLCGLILLFGFASLVKLPELLAMGPKIKMLLLVNLFLLFGVLVFILILFSPKKLQEKVLVALSHIPKLSKILSKIFHALWTIGADKSRILKTLALSCICQLLNSLAFWVLCSPYFSNNLSFSNLLTILPIAFISMSVPIAPMGLGVGHTVFAGIFLLFGVDNGASLFNLYILSMTTTFLLGVFPYLSMGSFKISELEKINQETSD